MWEPVGRLTPKQKGELVEEIEKTLGPCYHLERVGGVYETLNEDGGFTIFLVRRCPCGHVQILDTPTFKEICNECENWWEVR